MRRLNIDVRPHWQELVEAKGMHYHTVDGHPYWDESACYEFTPEEVDVIEAATYELDRICLEAIQHVIDHDRFDAFHIPREYRRTICAAGSVTSTRSTADSTWPTTAGTPKVLEYNADTPTGAARGGGDPVVLAQGSLPRVQTSSTASTNG